jgi:hypothetical protein
MSRDMGFGKRFFCGTAEGRKGDLIELTFQTPSRTVKNIRRKSFQLQRTIYSHFATAKVRPSA